MFNYIIAALIGGCLPYWQPDIIAVYKRWLPTCLYRISQWKYGPQNSGTTSLRSARSSHRFCCHEFDRDGDRHHPYIYIDGRYHRNMVPDNKKGLILSAIVGALWGMPS